jgi:hypothetical protein
MTSPIRPSDVVRFFKRLLCRHHWHYSRSRSRLYCPTCDATRRVP